MRMAGLAKLGLYVLVMYEALLLEFR